MTQTNCSTKLNAKQIIAYILNEQNEPLNKYYKKLILAYAATLHDHLSTKDEIIKNCTLVTLSKILNIFATYKLPPDKIKNITPINIWDKCVTYNKDRNRKTIK